MPMNRQVSNNEISCVVYSMLWNCLDMLGMKDFVVKGAISLVKQPAHCLGGSEINTDFLHMLPTARASFHCFVSLKNV